MTRANELLSKMNESSDQLSKYWDEDIWTSVESDIMDELNLTEDDFISALSYDNELNHYYATISKNTGKGKISRVTGVSFGINVSQGGNAYSIEGNVTQPSARDLEFIGKKRNGVLEFDDGRTFGGDDD